MPTVELRNQGNSTQYVLVGRVLHNEDAIEIRLHGNRGWTSATIAGLPEAITVHCEADDGTSLVTSLPPGTEVRWPEPD